MPNPKVGTVTMDVTTAVKNAKAGQVQYRTDKAGIVHATIGRAFSVENLETNLKALIEALQKAKPAAAKGQYLKKIAVSPHGSGRARRPGFAGCCLRTFPRAVRPGFDGVGWRIVKDRRCPDIRWA